MKRTNAPSNKHKDSKKLQKHLPVNASPASPAASAQMDVAAANNVNPGTANHPSNAMAPTQPNVDTQASE